MNPKTQELKSQYQAVVDERDELIRLLPIALIATQVAVMELSKNEYKHSRYDEIVKLQNKIYKILERQTNG